MIKHNKTRLKIKSLSIMIKMSVKTQIISSMHNTYTQMYKMFQSMTKNDTTQEKLVGDFTNRIPNYEKKQKTKKISKNGKQIKNTKSKTQKKIKTSKKKTKKVKKQKKTKKQ